MRSTPVAVFEVSPRFWEIRLELDQWHWYKCEWRPEYLRYVLAQPSMPHITWNRGSLEWTLHRWLNTSFTVARRVERAHWAFFFADFGGHFSIQRPNAEIIPLCACTFTRTRGVVYVHVHMYIYIMCTSHDSTRSTSLVPRPGYETIGARVACSSKKFAASS